MDNENQMSESRDGTRSWLAGQQCIYWDPFFSEPVLLDVDLGVYNAIRVGYTVV